MIKSHHSTVDLLLVALTLALLLPFGEAHAQGRVETFEYVIREGDTCAKISHRFFGNRRRWDLIHRHNKNMGPTPHKLVPGQTLTLPKQEQSADAKLTAVRRTVETREPKRAEWLPASVGKDLYRGWRVNTQARSAAEVTFRDDSTVQMREKTLIIIYGGGSTSRTARRQTSEASLEKGTLRSRLGEFRLTVKTPSAEADLKGGSSVVSVDDKGTSRLSHHRGSAKFRVAKGGSVRVKPGYGTKVKKGQKKPDKPRPLPPAPSWKDGKERVYAGFDVVGASVVGRWRRVKEAAFYRVEITREGGERRTISAARVPASVTNFELHRLPEGVYKATVSAIDADKFESKASKPFWIDVRTVALDLPGDSELAATDPDKVHTKPPVPKVLIGTQVLAPDTFICSIGGGEAGAQLRLMEAGKPTLSCRSERTKIQNTLTLDVVEPTIAFGDGVGNPQLTRGEPLTVPLAISTPVPLPQDIRFEGPDGVEVSANGTGSIKVLAAEDSPDSFTVDLVSGEGRDRVEFGSLSFTASDRPQVVVPEGRAYAPQEAFGLALSPNAMGLRDDRREGSGLFFNVSQNGQNPSGDGYWRASVGLEVSPVERLRLGVAGALDLRTEGLVPGQRGDRDLLGWVGYRIIARDDISLSAELAAWFPLGPDPSGVGHTRLTPSLELSGELAERVLLRTRQGGIIALESNGLRAWASAYGIDVKLIRRVALGLEGDLVIGRGGAQTLVGVAIGGGLSVLAGPASLHFGGRYGITDEFRALVGKLTLSMGVRFTFQ